MGVFRLNYFAKPVSGVRSKERVIRELLVGVELLLRG